YPYSIRDQSILQPIDLPLPPGVVVQDIELGQVEVGEDAFLPQLITVYSMGTTPYLDIHQFKINSTDGSLGLVKQEVDLGACPTNKIRETWDYNCPIQILTADIDSSGRADLILAGSQGATVLLQQLEQAKPMDLSTAE